MIYEKHNFNESFVNATGQRRGGMAIAQLGKIIKRFPQETISAIADSGVEINPNATSKEIIKTIMMNRRNKRMIMNISAIMFASSSVESQFSNLNDGVEGGEKGGKAMKQIGEFFKAGKESRTKRREERKASGKPSVFQKIGTFFNKNKENITAIGGGLVDGLKNRTGQTDLTNTQNTGGTGNEGAGNEGDGDVKPTFFQKNKTLIIVGIVLVGGFIGYKMYSKKK